jgi:hypothetical protein
MNLYKIFLSLGLAGAIVAPSLPSMTMQETGWDRRPAGAGDYQIVMEISGRVEVARAMRQSNPLDLKSICAAKTDAERRAFLSAESYLAALQKSVDADRRAVEIARLQNELGQLWSYRGDMTKALSYFEAMRDTLSRAASARPEFAEDLISLDEILGVISMRKGELENCVHHHNAERCLFPLTKQAEHQLTAGSSAAVIDFKRHLTKRPNNLETRWLLNLAYMTLGRYPKAVPPPFLIPTGASVRSLLPRYPDVAGAAGVDVVSGAGGSIIDDFDNDGLNDILISSVDACESLHYFHNDGDGRFSDRTEKAGLAGQIGGINCVQTNYNNDGFLDVFVMRGGWEFAMRNSLLRNNGDGTFSDVTAAAGLLSGDHRTHSAAWADFDNDGWLDLFVGHEETPSQLFRNRGDGGFEDVSKRAGVNRTAFTKGVVWGDYDNDDFPDLYVSNYGGENFLYHNQKDGTFEELGARLGVSKPLMSFPTWFFDYDNDGRLDLFVASFVPSVAEVARGYLGLPPLAETMRLYRNKGNGEFEDVSRQAGLARVAPVMGANFGDLNNDGFLDFYLGTGAPSYAALTPNLAFLNQNGKSFVDVTASTGTGHLQKGHGVAFSDLDNDGDQDLFANIGGFVPGDKYNKALFANPTENSRWISLKLIGVKSNRAAIGAKIKIMFRDASGKESLRYREVTSGGSFGASSLTQEIGLGSLSKTQLIDAIEIHWPASQLTQRFNNVPANQFLRIKESGAAYEELAPRSFNLVPQSGRVPPHSPSHPGVRRGPASGTKP